MILPISVIHEINWVVTHTVIHVLSKKIGTQLRGCVIADYACEIKGSTWKGVGINGFHRIFSLSKHVALWCLMREPFMQEKLSWYSAREVPMASSCTKVYAFPSPPPPPLSTVQRWQKPRWIMNMSPSAIHFMTQSLSIMNQSDSTL